MKDLWPFIVIGLTSGSIYGLTAIGLVLTYKTSGIFNFAHGSIAVVSACLLFLMYEAHDWPWWLAILDAVIIAGPLMGLMFERIARQLVVANAAYKVVATIGVLLIVSFLAPTAVAIDNDILDLPEGSGEARRAQWLPSGTETFGGVVFGHDQLITMAVALVAAIGLSYVLRKTRTGMAMRAVVDSPELLDLTGSSPIRVRRSAWILGASFAALSGALLAPAIGVNFTILTGLVIQATGAAAFGAFSSLPLAYVGGLVLGVLQNVAVKWIAGRQNWVAGIPAALPFIFLFVAILVVPKRKLSEVYRPLPQKIRKLRNVPPVWKYGPTVAVGLGLLSIPLFYDFTTGWTRFLTYVILFLSLGLLVKTSGQISLGHYAFAAVGAAMFHHFADSAGMPWLLALVLAGLCCVPVGALIALPAIRLSGVFLALGTYAFAIAVENLFYRTTGMFGLSSGGIRTPRPGGFDSEAKFYYVVLAILVVVLVILAAINRSRLGRILRGLGESPTALETQGTSINVTRILLFCISAFFAGVSGALFGASQFFVAGSSFSAAQSLVLIALVMIAPGRQPWYALFAAMGLAIIRDDIGLPKIGVVDLNQAAAALFGLVAVWMAMVAYKHRPPDVGLRGLWNRIADRFAPPIENVEEAGVVIAHREVDFVPEVRGAGLRVEGLTVRYGALVAVDALDLTAPTGRITGLVGPNGAGKSTTFDACSGLVRPSHGHVFLHDRDVTDRGPAQRARMGLGRTFQRVQLWNALTVRENVALGREGSMAGGNPLKQLRATRAERDEVETAVDAALAMCGIAWLQHHEVAGLTTGQRRLVELARCLAGPFDLLLLDEPSSGLDSAESRRFGQVLQQVVRERGTGILLVEHDMQLVMDVCQHIYVLDVGQLIFQGSPAETQASELVRAAYLGSSDLELGIAGT